MAAAGTELRCREAVTLAVTPHDSAQKSRCACCYPARGELQSCSLRDDTRTQRRTGASSRERRQCKSKRRTHRTVGSQALRRVAAHVRDLLGGSRFNDALQVPLCPNFHRATWRSASTLHHPHRPASNPRSSPSPTPPTHIHHNPISSTPLACQRGEHLHLRWPLARVTAGRIAQAQPHPCW